MVENTVKTHLNNNINIKNYMIVGDFNIDTVYRNLAYDDNNGQQ